MTVAHAPEVSKRRSIQLRSGVTYARAACGRRAPASQDVDERMEGARMSTYIPGAIWTGQVPFESDNKWVLEGIAAFNKAVNKNLWIPRTNEANYVTFTKAEHHMSDIGKTGGKQNVDYAED